MRLAFLYDAVYPWETGGVQKRVWELGRRLAADHDVHWYGLKYWDGPAVVERDGVTLHGVGEPPELYVDGRRSIPEALAYAARLVRPLARERFDVIDCQEFPYFPAFAGKLGTLTRETTLLFTWHEVWDRYWYDYLGWKGVFGQAVERLTIRLPDAHVAVSERTRRDTAALGVSEAHLVPNGIDVDAVTAAPEADRAVDVLFVGRLIPEKNPRLVVEAVDHLRDRGLDVTGTIVGEGPERGAVERQVARTGLDEAVDVLDFRESHDDILGLMKAADVFVLPSEREGFGITVLEALACGTPVVTIDHPSNAATELVDERVGAVADPTGAALADAIRDARGVGSAAPVARARQYEWDEIATQAEALYREVA